MRVKKEEARAVNKLRDIIASNCDNSVITTAELVPPKDKEKRTGLYSDMLIDALTKSNVKCIDGTYYWFNGRYYQEISEKSLQASLQAVLITKGVSAEDRANRGKIIANYAMSICRANNVLTPEGRSIICFQNTVLDVDDMDTADHHPDFHVMSEMKYDYDPNAKCPTWDKFIKEVLPIESVRNTLQEFLGAIFIDRRVAKIEQMCVLLGTGANGKGVVYSTINEIMGATNISHFDINNLSTSKAHEYNIDSINGKLLNYCSDLAKQDITGQGFKNIVSGEEIPARKIFGDPYTATMIPLMMANTNSMPATVDQTHGYYRRWLPIPFDVEIRGKNQDKTLPATMKTELSGIFNWIMEGRARYVARNYNFTESEEINAEIQNYMNDTDATLQFLTEKRYTSYPTYDGQIAKICSINSVYKEYLEWAPTAGKKIIGKNEVNNKIKSKGFVKKHTSRFDAWVIFETPFEDDYEFLSGTGKTTMSREDFIASINSKSPPNVKEGVEKAPYKPPVQSKVEFPKEPEVTPTFAVSSDDEPYDPDDHPPID